MTECLKGKKGIIFGVANKRSLAWAIAQSLSNASAEIALTYQNERLQKNVMGLAEALPSACTFQCDATKADDLSQLFKDVEAKWNCLDFVIHSIAFAKTEELKGEYVHTSEDGFQLALNVSAYTLTSIAKAASLLLAKSESGGSIVTLTYLGGERVMPGYNVMGVAKSALEMSVRYLAHDLGDRNIRVNGISAGPVNTLAARGIHGFSGILKHVSEKAPLKRNIEASEVGDTALFLCSSLSRGITGEVIHVDAGFHVMA